MVCTLVYILIFLISTSQAVRDTAFSNALLDFILLNSANEMKTHQELTWVPAPNWENTLFLRVPIVGNTSAHFEATHATLSDLSTLHRVGTSSLEIEGTTATLRGTVSLSHMKVKFARYTVRAPVLKTSGFMSFDIKANSIYISLALTLHGDKCLLYMNDFMFFRLRDIDVRLAGLKPYNILTSVILQSFKDNIETYVKSSLEKSLKEKYNKSIFGNNFCRKFFG